MPFLLDDDRTAEMFEHFAESELNGEEYIRLSKIQGHDLSASIEFTLQDGYELRIVEQPNDGTELLIFMLNHITQRVAYYNCVERIDLHLDTISEDKPISQVMIWRAIRGEDAKASHNLVQAIFFKKLINNYNIVVSDTEQTRDGSRMWESLLFDAMESPDHIAATADTKSLHVNIIHNEKQLNSQVKWLWGQQDFHRNRLGVIAKLTKKGS
jgi:hypothetical protein